MKTVNLYTDGACSGNPGPGGWGLILEFQGHEKEMSGGEASTTNNRMELTHLHTVNCHWVKGHAENEKNNRCDQLAVSQSKQQG